MPTAEQKRLALAVLERLAAAHPPGGRVAAKLTSLAQLMTYADQPGELSRYVDLAREVARTLH